MQYVIDTERFQSALKRAGFKSLQDLAVKLRIHRNTIHHFLSGAPVFSDSISKVLTALDVEPSQILRKEKQHYGIEIIAPVIDALLEKRSNMCIVLFGSRARGTQKKFSDFDLGVYSREGMSHGEYLQLLSCKDDKTEDMPVTVDLINLNSADKDFLQDINPGMRFLGGRLSDWLLLKGSIDGQEAGRVD